MIAEIVSDPELEDHNAGIGSQPVCQQVAHTVVGVVAEHPRVQHLRSQPVLGESSRQHEEKGLFRLDPEAHREGVADPEDAEVGAAGRRGSPAAVVRCERDVELGAHEARVEVALERVEPAVRDDPERGTDERVLELQGRVARIDRLHLETRMLVHEPRRQHPAHDRLRAEDGECQADREGDGSLPD